MRLDFNETNILIQNLKNADKDHFINHLSEIVKNTKDDVLLFSAVSLMDKLLDISDLRFIEIFNDLKKGKIVSTMGYDV